MRTRKLVLIIADVVLLAVCIVQGIAGRRDGVVQFTCSADIDEISYESPAERFALIKEGDGWVGGEKKYPVNQTSVDGFINQLSEIRALDKVGTLGNANAAERYELDDLHKITVTAKKDGKVLRTITIGKEASASSQSYITIDDKKDIYLAAGNIRSTFSTSLNSIRSRSVWSLDKSAITSVTLKSFEGDDEQDASQAASALTIFKMGEGDDVVWNITGTDAGAVQVDGTKAQSWFDSLGTLVTPVWYDENEDLGGKLIVSAEITCAQETVRLFLYKIDGEDDKVTYYATSSKTPYVFELASYAAERFLKTADDFAK